CSSDLAAGIPYPVIGAVEVVDDFLQGCSPPGVKVDVDGGRLALVGGRLQGKSLPGPGHQAAVQVAPAGVADHVEGPGQAPCPTAPLVVIHHHLAVGAEAEAGEERGETGGLRE